ncbi:MAG: hypothetical protein WAO58_00265 [Fimbriimonadaceae bacterium]
MEGWPRHNQDGSTLTTKLGENHGDYVWSGTGRRLLSGSSDHWAYDIWQAGSNVYVTGKGKDTGQQVTPQHAQYLTTALDKNGDVRSERFSDYFPDEPYQAAAGLAITVHCEGEAYVSVRYYNNDQGGGLYNFGLLQYAQTKGVEAPGSNFSIDRGTRMDSNTNPLDSSNDVRLEVERGIVPGGGLPYIIVTVNGNVGTDPVVSELCFEVEAQSVGNIDQEILLWNYNTGQYVPFDRRDATTSDRKLHMTVPTDPDPYIDSSGNVKARIQYYVTGPVTGAWQAKIDLAIWKYLN